MPLEGHAGIRFGHAFSVIHYLYQCLPGILNEQPDIGSSGIYGILQQLFHSAGRALDDFARRYLVCDVIG